MDVYSRAITIQFQELCRTYLRATVTATRCCIRPCRQYHERSADKYVALYADRRFIFSISYIDLQFCDFLSWLLRGIVCSALFSARIVQVVYPWCTVSLWISPIFLKDRQVFAHLFPIDIWRTINRVRIIIPLISAVRGATSAWIWQLQAAPFYLFDPLPRISKAVSSQADFIKSISSIPTAQKQVLSHELSLWGRKWLAFKRLISFFAYLSLVFNSVEITRRSIISSANQPHDPTEKRCSV
jgi:hypothetical protein